MNQAPFAFLAPRQHNLFQVKVVQTLEFLGIDRDNIILDTVQTIINNNTLSLSIRNMEVEKFQDICREKARFLNLNTSSYSEISSVQKIFDSLGMVTVENLNNSLMHFCICQRGNSYYKYKK